MNERVEILIKGLKVLCYILPTEGEIRGLLPSQYEMERLRGMARFLRDLYRGKSS